MKDLNDQILEKKRSLPDYVIACVGGGSNAIGAFLIWRGRGSRRWGKAAGHSLDADQHAATMTQKGLSVGYWDEDLCSLWRRWKSSASLLRSLLVWTGVGPEHAFLCSGRVEYVATDGEAVEALLFSVRRKDHSQPLKAHTRLQEAVKRAPKLDKDKII